MKINNFYKNEKVAKFQEVKRKNTFSRNSISKLIFKKISSLPRNIFFDYKISNNNNSDKKKLLLNIDRKISMLPPVKDYVPDLTPERRINILIDYLKKEKINDLKFHSVTPKIEFKSIFNCNSNRVNNIKSHKSKKSHRNIMNNVLELQNMINSFINKIKNDFPFEKNSNYIFISKLY